MFTIIILFQETIELQYAIKMLEVCQDLIIIYFLISYEENTLTIGRKLLDYIRR
jgi:hypothetical protein